jgi:hypothetical protein
LAGESIEPLRDWTPPALPLTGGALVERGISKIIIRGRSNPMPPGR